MIRRLLVLTALALVVSPAGANAAFLQIDGSPLDVFVSDTGRMQARFDGETSGEIFPSSSNEANSGLSLGVDMQSSSRQLYGYAGSSFTPVSLNQPDPFTIVSTYQAPVQSQSSQQGVVRVTQTVTYAQGAAGFRVRYDITSTGSGNVTFRPQMGADLTPGGSDSGFGYLAGAPGSRVVGGLNTRDGGTAAIGEITPFAKYQADHYSTITSRLADLSPSGGLTNFINPEFVDIGAGVQWNEFTICCNQAAVIETDWRFTRYTPFELTPATAERVVGDTHSVSARVQNPDGFAAAGVPVQFTVNGSNTATGVVATGADGVATFNYEGTESGTDFITAFADPNANGIQDSGESQGTAQADWLAPVPGSTVALQPVRGTVLVKLPRGSSARAAGFTGARARKAQAGGFVPLGGVQSIPVRSIVDVNKGEVKLTSAANLQGLTQSANFYSGRFQILQNSSSRPVTELRMNGGNFSRTCRLSKRSAVGSARGGRRVRRLWGNGRGRFRTRGRYSSATVRGTTWLVEDRCGGTLTRVARTPRTNRVVVRDFGKRRNVTLRAGRSYLALPRKR